MRPLLLPALCAITLGYAALAEPPASAPPTAPATKGMTELSPGIRADVSAKAVEFDAEVIVNLSDPKRTVYLEVLACPRNTKEHESLVMTSVKPSMVHAAMLAAGFKPGAPVTWREEAGKSVPTPATGDPVRVEFRWTDPASGEARSAGPLEWVKNSKTGERASELKESGGFVFAGSVMVKKPTGGERYDADDAGTLIGLASFGSETVAWTRAFSPDSSVDAPVWIADRERVPKIGTKVVVRLTPAPGGT